MTPALHLLLAIALHLSGGATIEGDARTTVAAAESDTVASRSSLPEAPSPAPGESIEDSDDDDRHAATSCEVLPNVRVARELDSAPRTHRPSGPSDSVAAHAPRGPPLA